MRHQEIDLLKLLQKVKLNLFHIDLKSNLKFEYMNRSYKNGTI